MSADYRLLPQASGKDLWEDVKDAYEFVVTKLPNILNNSSASRGAEMARKGRRIIVGGASAGLWSPLSRFSSEDETDVRIGAYLAFLATARFEDLNPPPIATLGYYPCPSFKHPFFNSSRVLNPKPLKREELASMLDDEKVLTGTDTGVSPFEVKSLNEDLSHNTAFTPQEPGFRAALDRPDIYDWLVQENEYPKTFGDLEGNIEAEKEKFPKVIIMHSKGDEDCPIELSRDYVEGVGKEKGRLVAVEGNDHVFDEWLFLEDGGERVEKVQEAWKLLDAVVARGEF